MATRAAKAAQPPASRQRAGPGAPGTHVPATRRILRADGYERMLATEWLLTNGLGGFAMGTAAGVPSRRYHGLLVAATRPPVGRIVALNAMVETLEIDGRTYELSTFRFGAGGRTLHPKGHEHLTSFECDLSARWTWTISAARIAVMKEVYLHERNNTVSVRYTLKREGTSAGRARLMVRPLVSMRDFHGTIRRAWSDRFAVEPAKDGRGCAVSLDGRTLRLSADGAFALDQQWWYDFDYAVDGARGQDCAEDLFSPGCFAIEAGPAGPASMAATITATLGAENVPDLDSDKEARRDRLSALCKNAMRDASIPERDADSVSALVCAADQFVVARLDPERGGALSGVSTIAGYPWFSDWGRDTFVSLPGLMLATGRFDEARRTLLAFAAHRRGGLIPNVFNDQSGEPEYNTVDGSLWFIHGACRYLEATGDRRTFDADLLPACLDIVAAYRRGTEFNIAMDPQDKLITAGALGTQLTWMDAKRDGVVFTPRHGKPVEINALWYSGLRSLAEALRASDGAGAAHLADLADAVGRSFGALFWNAGAECLYDCLTPGEAGGRAVWTPNADIRPNQIFAVSLPHSPLEPARRRAVLASVRSRLYTPMGLRTLDAGDSRFRARFEGNLFERDGAYHNGTAWPWLLGAYAEAILRVGGFGESAKREAREAIGPILGELGAGRATGSTPACLGQIAEIYDGGEPQRPQGCTAQAWSVAELLRVLLMTY